MPLSEDDIQRITRAVIEQLGTRADAGDVERAVQTIVPDTVAADTAELSGGAAHRPLDAPAIPHPDAHPEIERPDPAHNRIIVATFGRNRPGVVAALTSTLAENNCDITDITQKILQEFFSMIMIVDITASPIDFATLREKFNEIESRLGVTIVAQHEDVFRAMHRI